MSTLITKYRPSTFDQVVGQDQLVRSIQGVLAKGTARAFILAGPAGTGKTTVGRLIAQAVKANPHNITEVDAASKTGIDDMRALTSTLGLAALGDSPARVFIIDEAHMLSKAAWNSLLKAVEEPPPHLYWVFCTTDPAKIPSTIKTRCQQYTTVPVGDDALLKLLRSVAKQEKLSPAEGVLELIVENAAGSPREALSELALCAQCEDEEEARRLLRRASQGDDATIDLCRTLASGTTAWSKLAAKATKIEGDAESVRFVVFDYMSKVAAGATDPAKAAAALSVLDAFKTPYPQNAGVGHLLLSLGRIAFESTGE